MKLILSVLLVLFAVVNPVRISHAEVEPDFTKAKLVTGEKAKKYYLASIGSGSSEKKSVGCAATLVVDGFVRPIGLYDWWDNYRHAPYLSDRQGHSSKLIGIDTQCARDDVQDGSSHYRCILKLGEYAPYPANEQLSVQFNARPEVQELKKCFEKDGVTDGK